MSNKKSVPVVNKHGLSRTIPTEVKRTVRRQDGYGCVICGKMLVDYEHIDPLFCDALEHHPDHIALLCSEHHDEVTRRILPKRIVKESKANPYCKKRGFANSSYFPHPEDIKIKCGNSYFEDTKKIIEINGKPIIWIEEEEGRVLFNAVFYDSEGNKIGYLNRNTFFALVGNCDVYAVASRIEARLKQGTINLTLDIKADGIVELKRLSSNYGGTKVIIDNKGRIEIDNHGSKITMDSCQIFNCGGALSIGEIPKYKGDFFALSKFQKEKLKGNLPKIVDFFGTAKGYIFYSEIIDLHGLTSGYFKESKVYNLLGEYIGDLVKAESEDLFTIETDSDEYEDREPIYIEKRNRIANRVFRKKIMDTSYRILN
ncbi:MULTISPECIES: HNH endonuclease signature motif containing protein [unclassified Psychrobacter]|uniref:HNH endonuclease signature motif containing protein n=1 Tax=unclassified Psychrobacter TaxID=196806 RepID=UPI0018F63636|nr:MULTISPECIES: HNH endonuclease signature motif containing protein [unclassified Psychrobacter]